MVFIMQTKQSLSNAIVAFVGFTIIDILFEVSCRRNGCVCMIRPATRTKGFVRTHTLQDALSGYVIYRERSRRSRLGGLAYPTSNNAVTTCGNLSPSYLLPERSGKKTSLQFLDLVVAGSIFSNTITIRISRYHSPLTSPGTFTVVLSKSIKQFKPFERGFPLEK